ncbi:chromate efflux transporter [Haliscomenobacter sp.]|uniref:chromate efflux transporter n=1 Tax=Haliscomenobacter sp. TaxID=2717303 RepID=UPI003364F2CF
MAYPSFREAFQVWLKVALYSFGGPAGQIAVMHKYIVEEKKWLGENRFLHALNYCMLLPGPEAQQLATYIGWLMHKTRGGLMAGGLFVLPGFLSILILSVLYALWKDLTFVQGIFYGIKPTVLAVVVGAVIKIGKRALKNEVMVGIAVLAFIAIFFFKISFPYIVIAAGLLGYFGGRIWEEKFYVIKGHADKTGSEAGLIDSSIQSEKPNLSKILRVALFWLALWLLPVAGLLLWLGSENVFTKEALFFSKSAIVTFGGAYSVLAYISQKAVETYAWVQPGEMLDGLGMAETTPGPLIQVVQFVGFMGAFRNAGTLDPILAGVLASVLVTWVTYLPSFLFIFTGAPYIEYLRGNKSLSTALSGITAAVVGVILNLGIWFSLHTLFGKVDEVLVGPLYLPLPVWNTVDWGAVFITVAALFFSFRLKWDMLRTIGVCIVLGLIFKFFIL